MPSESSREPLPFEPRQTKKKTPKKEPVAAAPTTKTSAKTDKRRQNRRDNRDPGAIPEAVSKRMIRRMAFFSGIPTALGISSFVISYYIVINEIIELPSVAVLLVSLGFFGLGVIGLSYGLLSTSWDEERTGSLLGSDEFTLNLGRMVQAWKEGRKEARSKS
ncbi:hypothetical protein Lepto7376_3401 [[Leptolyngbya] sp. PCC 7376]|uniref:PAM68 family protein n=1 Tax=[Leptolyngbya] sp. PCC 7376 TaxID=111781 RepID=UPI00029ECEF1|nr:PAM68 family protein [[Leptolyngbya] sp. PCC 7376]AFY39608.1 hypothetical protein Lepto7376_3401 [[Leptolyngbya] sp. PCC 7376]